MRVAAFSIKEFEKELLEKENGSRHEICYFPDTLSLNTITKCAGCKAVLVFTNDDVSSEVVKRLADMGIQYVATRSVGIDHIDTGEAERSTIKVANVPAYSPEAVAEHAVLLALALARKLIPSVNQCKEFNFSIEGHMGFNLNKKTVGIIGMGRIGRAASTIFSGFGCRVIGFDIDFPNNLSIVEETELDSVFAQADIISLHLPLTSASRYIINAESISKMRDKVTLINTGRGALLDTRAVLLALLEGKIGSLGIDVYENEKGLFFADHHLDKERDPLLSKLMALNNVIVTPHQAFLTCEAVTEIARSTIQSLNRWEDQEQTSIPLLHHH